VCQRTIQLEVRSQPLSSGPATSLRLFRRASCIRSQDRRHRNQNRAWHSSERKSDRSLAHTHPATSVLDSSAGGHKHGAAHSNGLEHFKASVKASGANEAAWLCPELKKLLDAAALADAHIKDRVKKMNDRRHGK